MRFVFCRFVVCKSIPCLDPESASSPSSAQIQNAAAAAAAPTCPTPPTPSSTAAARAGRRRRGARRPATCRRRSRRRRPGAGWWCATSTSSSRRVCNLNGTARIANSTSNAQRARLFESHSRRLLGEARVRLHAAAPPRPHRHTALKHTRPQGVCASVWVRGRACACVCLCACECARASAPEPACPRLRALSPRTRSGPRPRQLDPPTLRGWMRLLRRVPDAVLWLLRLPSAAEERCAAALPRIAGCTVEADSTDDRVCGMRALSVSVLRGFGPAGARRLRRPSAAPPRSCRSWLSCAASGFGTVHAQQRSAACTPSSCPRLGVVLESRQPALPDPVHRRFTCGPEKLQKF